MATTLGQTTKLIIGILGQAIAFIDIRNVSYDKHIFSSSENNKNLNIII